jgi:hypothetical protein
LAHNERSNAEADDQHEQDQHLSGCE